MINLAIISLFCLVYSYNTYGLDSLFDDVEVNYQERYVESNKKAKPQYNNSSLKSKKVSTKYINVSSLPGYRNTGGKKVVVVSIRKQAFGAYNSRGQLIKTGRVSTGKPGYRTKRGTFYSLQKRGGANCWSNKYKVGMPYCMFYHGGFAMHGYHDVPSYPASRGCIRMVVDDARWLHNNFVDNNTMLIVH